MKRHVQKTGIRKYFGEDFIELQAEGFKVLDAFFGEYQKQFVIQGCEITATPAAGLFDISAGMVALSTTNPDTDIAEVKVMPFEGAQGVVLPAYLVAEVELISRVYGDGKPKPISYNYKAVVSGVMPSTPYIEVMQNDTVRFVDAIQDPKHTFISDAERLRWNDTILMLAKEYADTKKREVLEEASDTAEDKDVERSKLANKYADTKKSEAIEVMQAGDTALGKRIDSTNRVIEDLVGAAPDTLDTIHEIAAALTTNKDSIATILAQIGNKVNKVAGKGLSTNDYNNADKGVVETLRNFNPSTVDSKDDAVLVGAKKYADTKVSSLMSGDEFKVELIPTTDGKIKSFSTPKNDNSVKMTGNLADITGDFTIELVTAFENSKFYVNKLFNLGSGQLFTYDDSDYNKLAVVNMGGVDVSAGGEIFPDGKRIHLIMKRKDTTISAKVNGVLTGSTNTNIFDFLSNVDISNASNLSLLRLFNCASDELDAMIWNGGRWWEVVIPQEYKDVTFKTPLTALDATAHTFLYGSTGTLVGDTITWLTNGTAPQSTFQFRFGNQIAKNYKNTFVRWKTSRPLVGNEMWRVILFASQDYSEIIQISPTEFIAYGASVLTTQNYNTCYLSVANLSEPISTTFEIIEPYMSDEFTGISLTTDKWVNTGGEVGNDLLPTNADKMTFSADPLSKPTIWGSAPPEVAPDGVGQQYYDATNGVKYSAFVFSDGTLGWKAIASVEYVDNAMALKSDKTHQHGTLAPILINADDNLNSYQTAGMYYCPEDRVAQTLINSPTELAFSLFVEVHMGCKQTLTPRFHTSMEIYVRNSYNGAWGAWHRQYTTADKPTLKELGAAPALGSPNYMPNFKIIRGSVDAWGNHISGSDFSCEKQGKDIRVTHNIGHLGYSAIGSLHSSYNGGSSLDNVITLWGKTATYVIFSLTNTGNSISELSPFDFIIMEH